MAVLRFFWAILHRAGVWTFIGLVLLSGLIWISARSSRSGLRAAGGTRTVRLGVIAALFHPLADRLILAQRRAFKANRVFVAEIAKPEPKKPVSPGEESVAAVGAKFQDGD